MHSGGPDRETNAAIQPSSTKVQKKIGLQPLTSLPVNTQSDVPVLAARAATTKAAHASAPDKATTTRRRCSLRAATGPRADGRRYQQQKQQQ